MPLGEQFLKEQVYTTDQLRGLLQEFREEMYRSCWKYPVDLPELHMIRAASFLLWLEERQELKNGKQPDNRRSKKVSAR